MTYLEVVRQLWFLPGGKELLLDCGPCTILTIDTSTWKQKTPRFAGDHPLGPNRDEMRAASPSGRIIVTSPQHRSHILQNDTTLTFWDMVRHAPLRQVTVRPDQDLWICDDWVVVNEPGNVMLLSVRHGPRPGSGIEVWNLDKRTETPWEILNPTSATIDAAGRRIGHFHFSLDIETGRQRALLPQTNVIDFSPEGRYLLAIHGEPRRSPSPVLGNLIANAFDHRLLAYDADGKRIRLKSPRLPEDHWYGGANVKIAPDGRHVAVCLGDVKPTEIRIYRLRR
jgi:hypothetical protein